MSAVERLSVSVLNSTGNRFRGGREFPDPAIMDKLVAYFNGWREKYRVPVKFHFTDDPTEDEVYDIVVYNNVGMQDHLLGAHVSAIRKADFSIDVSQTDIDKKTGGQKQVEIKTFSDESLCWALGRWFLSKETKLSSRLASLREYDELSLRIVAGHICQMTGYDSEEVVCLLTEWDKSYLDYNKIFDPRIEHTFIGTLDAFVNQEREQKKKMAKMEIEIQEKDKKVQEINSEKEKRISRLMEQHQDEINVEKKQLQEKIHHLEKEKARVRDDKYDLEVKKAECSELSDKYKAALNSMATWNHLLNDMETKLKKDNKENTEQLLETVDQIWQGQKDEILFSIESMGDHVIGYLKSHGEALGTQTCSRPVAEDKSPLEENADLKNICSLLSKGLGDSWRELGRALEVSSRCLDDIEERYDRFATEELVWGVLNKWAEMGNPAKQVLLQAVQGIGQEAILGPPMTGIHRDLLQNLYPLLLNEMMDVELLMPYLRGEGILTSSQIDIILGVRGQFGKTDKLLKMLPNLGFKAFDGFVRALEQSGQKHIAKKLRDAQSKYSSVPDGVEIEGNTLTEDIPEETIVRRIGRFLWEMINVLL